MNRSEMKLLDHALQWDELKPGVRWRTHGRTITEADLVNFINASWLTEPLFTSTDPTDLEGMVLARRVVPGAMVYAFAEGLAKATMEAVGLAFLEATLTMKGPTVVGDTLHVECEVLETRSTSKPGRGVVRYQVDVVNQRGEAVMTYTPVRLARCPA